MAARNVTAELSSRYEVTSLCILGCGNLGASILSCFLQAKTRNPDSLPFDRFVASVRSEESKAILENRFVHHASRLKVITAKENLKAVLESCVILLCVDPAQVGILLEGLKSSDSCTDTLLISLIAGWTCFDLVSAFTATEAVIQTCRVIRVLPNINAHVAESITAIENHGHKVGEKHFELTEVIFQTIGKTIRVRPDEMSAATAVGGSTPAFFAVICDAMIDAAVAVGLTRSMARNMIYQSMRGTAAMLQSGLSPGEVREIGTSPEGCTLAGLMVLEENAVRGHISRAVREAVTAARLMKSEEHINDTKRPMPNFK